MKLKVQQEKLTQTLQKLSNMMLMIRQKPKLSYVKLEILEKEK
jgi:hypothetical protein